MALLTGGTDWHGTYGFAMSLVINSGRLDVVGDRGVAAMSRCVYRSLAGHHKLGVG